MGELSLAERARLSVVPRAYHEVQLNLNTGVCMFLWRSTLLSDWIEEREALHAVAVLREVEERQKSAFEDVLLRWGALSMLSLTVTELVYSENDRFSFAL